MTICVYELPSGEVRYRKIACKCREQVAEFFRSLPRPHMVAIEAVGFYRWLWELLEPMVEKLFSGRRHGCPRFGRPTAEDRPRGRLQRGRVAGPRPLAGGLRPARRSPRAAGLDPPAKPPFPRSRPHAARRQIAHESEQPARSRSDSTPKD